MPIPKRETIATDREGLLVQVTDDGSRTLLIAKTGDGFHSGCGAAAETRHVYLKNSGVTDRLLGGRATRVLEIGLGTGMAMLMATDLAATYRAPLHYTAIETDWIAAETLRQLRPDTWVVDSTIVDDYLEYRDSHAKELPSRVTWRPRREITVEIHLEDFQGWQASAEAMFDAVFYDPFCPEHAPELWTTECFQKIRCVLSPDGKLTTYSCSRMVRDRLSTAGFDCERVPGPPGGKREVLIATPSN
ncbi:MAG: tRNA (5-methylaminomethyl-2-thiouridine)(34)-methyltransferase MnmD [Planctomycetota bacterium]